MGLTKQYLRFVPGPVFGTIASPTANIVFITFDDCLPKLVAVPACEDVIVWDISTNEIVFTLHGTKAEVNSIIGHMDRKQLAVGYADGMIKIFNLNTGSCNVSFSGHRTSVSCLAYDDGGFRLASGGKDTEIVIWDIVSETGMFRLKGHKEAITKCHFLKQKNVLISSSKDTWLKFWDLDTQHCFKTFNTHRSEVWDFVVLHDSRLITGASDSELRVWDLSFKPHTEEAALPKKVRYDTEENVKNPDENTEDYLLCTEVGTILREGKGRIVTISVDQTERLLVCHGPDKVVELFKILNPDEVDKRLQNRKRKERKKQQKYEENDETKRLKEVEITQTLKDEIQRLPSITTEWKIKSLVCFLGKESAKIAILLNNNCISLFDQNLTDVESVIYHDIKLPGHRSDVRTVKFNSDSTILLSASNESLKIWNRDSQRCICTMKCEYALSSLFAPGDRHCIIGTKTGKIQIFDIGSGILLENLEAHSEPVVSICSSDKHGLVSGSSDKDIKFWNFAFVNDENYPEISKRLTLVHSRTLKMSDGVTCITFSPDEKMLAIALLDFSVKIFFADTLKFYKDLYGHQLPVTCMDISYDNTLIVTGSQDRNVKIWGLEFGDCHKSIFAHGRSVTCLQFVPKTHMFFTGGDDKEVKQWDADNFQKINVLKGHQSEVKALTVSPDGMLVVSASCDKSLRMWEKTNEPLVLEEEQDMEKQAEYEKNAIEGEEHVIPGEIKSEASGLAGKKTIEAIKSVKQLIEAIDIYKEEKAKLQEYELKCQFSEKNLPFPTPHPLITVFSTTCPVRYMLEMLRKVKSSDLEETMLLLPFNYVVDFLKILAEFLDRNWEIEITCRSMLFLLRVHFGEISGSQNLHSVLHKLRSTMIRRISEIRDVIGFNVAGLQFLQRTVDEQDEVALFADATNLFSQKSKARRKKQRSLLTFA